MATDQAPLTTEDYQQLHAMLLSEDAGVRAQGLGLAHKLTPDEQHAFFDVQQTTNAGKGERTRVDNSVGGLPPELAVTSGIGVARAVAAPAASIGARAVAGATNALGQAAPLVKYELTKSTLEHLGVPGPAAMAAAIMVSGYKTGAKKAAAAETAAPIAEAAAAEPVAAAATGGLSAVDEAALVKQGYSPAMIDKIRGQLRTPMATSAPAAAPTEFQAAQAARQANTLPDQKALNEAAIARRRAEYAASQTPASEAPVPASGKLHFTAPEWAEFQRLRKQGMSLEKAADGALAASALARQLGSATPAEVASAVASRKATGKW